MTDFISYRFKDETLLERALTHRSAGPKHNERMEFLGDAILGYVVADHLYRRFPDADEGQLTRTRASLVNRESLAGIARAIDLGPRLILGEGEMKSGGWRRDSILANSFEALVGAVFLDGGIEACARQIEEWFADVFSRIDPVRAEKDPKTRLQEYLQARKLPLPKYETVAVDGPPHDQRFTVECHIACLEQVVSAQGPSRRRGEQKAAQLTLDILLQPAAPPNE